MRALRINNKKNLFISLVAILMIITIIFENYFSENDL